MMSNPSKGLGRGLEALFKTNSDKVESELVKIVEIQHIKPNQNQPRRKYDDAALEDLANSIKAQGILQPILVRPIYASNPESFEIIAGERRWRSAHLAGLTEMPVIIKVIGDMETLAVALIENLQRENLNPLEESLAFRELKTEFGISQEDLAEKVGKSRSYIANALRLLQLPEDIQKLMLDSAISAGHARALLAITDTELQLLACKRILEDKLSVREAEKIASYWKEHGVLPSAEALQAQPSSVRKANNKSDQRPDAIMDLEFKIANSLDLKVHLNGDLSKGKLSISFFNESELSRLLNILGLEN